MQQPVENKPSVITRFARRYIYPLVSWIARIRRKRVVVAVLALFAVAGALYGYFETASKILDPVYRYFRGDPAAEEEKIKQWAIAYTIGENLGEYVFYQDHFKKGPPPGPKLEALRTRAESCAEAINSTAASIGIAVDVKKLETQPLLEGQWQSSHGFRYLRDSIQRAKGGHDAAMMFETGYFLSIFEKTVAVGDFQLTGDTSFPSEAEGRLNQVTYLGMPKYKAPSLKDGSTPAEKDSNKSELRSSLTRWEYEVRAKLKL